MSVTAQFKEYVTIFSRAYDLKENAFCEISLEPQLKGHSGRPSRLDNTLREQITEVDDSAEGGLTVRRVVEGLQSFQGDIASKSSKTWY